MDDAFAFAVGLEQQADEHHRRAGGADEAGEQSADGEDGGVDPRGGLDVAADDDAARDDVKAEQQREEGHVFLEHGVVEDREDR